MLVSICVLSVNEACYNQWPLDGYRDQRNIADLNLRQIRDEKINGMF